jgi:hypothetical protein
MTDCLHDAIAEATFGAALATAHGGASGLEPLQLAEMIDGTALSLCFMLAMLLEHESEDTIRMRCHEVGEKLADYANAHLRDPAVMH